MTSDALGVAELDGLRGTLVGRYRLIDVRQRPVGDPVHRGHAVLELGDGTRVLLEPVWSPAAVRPQAERSRLEGRRVEARGLVHAQAPGPEGPGEVANLLLPCLTDLEFVRPVDVEEEP